MKRIFSYPATIRKNLKRESDMPRLLTYLVTYKCNARCVICSSWKKENQNELTIEEIAKIFLKLPRLDAVRLTGGEPFIRKDFDHIVMLVQKILRPFFIYISSNGFLTERIIRFFEDRNKGTRLNIIISLDGFKEKHNSIRGKADAWDNAIRTIKELARHQKKFNCKVLVNQTIVDQESIEHYKLLREFLKKYKIRNNIVIADEATGTYSQADKSVIDLTSNNENYKTFGNLSKGTLIKLYLEASKDLKKASLWERTAKGYYLTGSKNRLLYNLKTPRPACVALNSHIRLLPDGSVPVCQFNTNRVGNLRDESFASIWDSDLRATYLDWIRKCPGCWAECEILPSAIYSGGLLRYKLLSIREKLKSAARNIVEPSWLYELNEADKYFEIVSGKDPDKKSNNETQKRMIS